MSRYVLYNDDVETARFAVLHSVITDFDPIRPELLPMQLRRASAEGFTAWIRERAIDLNNLQHRNLMNMLLNSRDRTTLALKTHMFSISDTFTCFEQGEFIPRQALCDPKSQNEASQFILLSSDTSLRQMNLATPNASTDGSFTKTWQFDSGEWWLYKLQSSASTRAEIGISRALLSCGWDAAEYAPVRHYLKRVRCRNFVGNGEFFEPYDSFRFFFDNPSDDDATIQRNLSSLGSAFAQAWRRILLSDALFFNTDRHMRNFGVIRSSRTGEVLRLAPNFDNNQAYLANPGGRYSPALLKAFMDLAEAGDRDNLKILCDALDGNAYFEQARSAGLDCLR